jgi:hypothetical protein
VIAAFALLGVGAVVSWQKRRILDLLVHPVGAPDEPGANEEM